MMDGFQRLLAYVKRLARPDGGYGWEDQPDSYIVPTFCVIGIYHLLNQSPLRRAELATYLRKAHPIRSEQAETRRHTGDPRLFLYQQVQGLLWLQEDPIDYVAEASSFVSPQEYPLMYELKGYPILREQALAAMCRRLLGVSPVITPALADYFTSRRRPNGTYNNTPADDGSDGNLLNTWWSLMALQGSQADMELSKESLTRACSRPDLTIWVQQCQRADGGFSYQPGAGPGNRASALYTLAAVWLLSYLQAQPISRAACVRYLLSLVNADGGCAHRPGEPSCPMATMLVVAALAMLGELHQLRTKTAATNVQIHRPSLPAGLRVFTVQLQAPGSGSPAEAVALARALNIDLWGAKNCKPGWIARAQEIAAQEQVPVTFFPANEEYGTYVGLPGLGNYTHVCDPIAPAGAEMGLNLAGKCTPWDDFRKEKLEPLEARRGRMLWQICDNEEFAQILLDDTIDRGGYAAISTFHFGCRNMAYTLPFVFRYRHRIPFIALQDAHGVDPWWWTDNLAGFRTLFLAEEPSYEAWLTALEKHWVVAARHDADTFYRTRLLGGALGVQEFIRTRESEWRWWDTQDPTKLRRPVLSIVAVRPGDKFEAVQPESGLSLILRCQWVTNHMAVLLQPVVELTALWFDGKQLDWSETKQENQRGQIIDHYCRSDLFIQTPGKHAVQAELRYIATGDVYQVEQEVSL